MSGKKKHSEAENENPAENENTAPETGEVTPETQEPAEEVTGTVEEAPPAPSAEELIKAEKDRYLRLAAEYDNYRKRTQKEMSALYATVRADTVTKLLPVYDNLERALKQDTEDAAFKKGIEMTMQQMNEILANLGVTPIEAVGQQFNANLHNAVRHIEDDNYGKNVIVEEYQKGFTLGDNVIRFSMVVVAN